MAPFQPTKAQALANLDDALGIVFQAGVKPSECLTIVRQRMNLLQNHPISARQSIALDALCMAIARLTDNAIERGL